MPSRNVLKVDVPGSYYHIYARGASRSEIFLDTTDYKVFLGLFMRYLSQKELRDSAGMPYKKLYDDIELVCYCLMPNHFHLVVYQVHAGAMQRLMRGVMTAYSRYFNKTYKRSGSLFESRYKASRIASDDYLMHITRYIHLNPKNWQDYSYSSLECYIGENDTDWLHETRIIELFQSKEAYGDFVADYEAVKESLDLVKADLAGYSSDS